MLEVQYSLDEAINMSGTQKDVELFRQVVLEFLESDLKSLCFEIEKNINAESWDFVATGLEIVKNDKPVKVSISTDGIVKIEGSKDNLEKFTSFVEFEESPIKGRHSHFEYYDYEGNIYVHPDSFPLIIGIK